MRNTGEIVAHDVTAERLRPLLPRALRAGATIMKIRKLPLPSASGGEGKRVFDVVLIDSPCSGTGTWRRQPELRWRLTPERLKDLMSLQDTLLDRAAVLEARLSRDDALSVDNSASAIVPPPRKLRVLVVTEKNSLLDSVLAGLPLLEYPFIKPAQWEANAEKKYEVEGQTTFDVVIFDKYQPKRLPKSPLLSNC